MSLGGRRWVWLQQPPALVEELSRELGLSSALARVLVNRGLDDPGSARAFLSPSIGDLHSPWLMLGMKPAVGRIRRALDNNEKIVIHGDYDADGVSAAVILVETLRALGGNVSYYLPSRFDGGYGLHREPLRRFREEGASLVVTVDCGINAAAETGYALSLGLDLIITDHHQPLGPLDGALAVLNPLQQDCPYPFKELSGAGIAFKLASALHEAAGLPFPSGLLDLAALGTAADVVPLLGENRVIVSGGLEGLRRLDRVGFRALAAASGLDAERISGTTLAFILAPAINAAGRLGEARPASELLLTADRAEAAELASFLHGVNRERRRTEQEITAEAEEAASARDMDRNPVITLASEGWHHGVIGIVASRLVERFNRPVALVALDGDEGRGSARSIPGFNITGALAGCAPLLERFGGHEQAAGFTVRAENLAALDESLNRYARERLDRKSLVRMLYLDAELGANEINLEFAASLEKLQPTGTGNPAPLFGSRSWEIVDFRLVGARKNHLKLNLCRDSEALDPIFFDGEGIEPLLERGRRVDLAFRLKNGLFRNRETIDAELKDLCYSDLHQFGSLGLVDLRRCGNRARSAAEALRRHGSGAVLFAATTARAAALVKNCRTGHHPRVFTSGSPPDQAGLTPPPRVLILYDLPLSCDLLRPLLAARGKVETMDVYMLFDETDCGRNAILLDHALPSLEMLEKIFNNLARAVQKGAEPLLPGSAGENLGFRPAEKFWRRVSKMMSESGLLREGRLLPRPGGEDPALSRCLEASPTYIEAETLRKRSTEFQRLLLGGSPAEIAAVLAEEMGGPGDNAT